TSAKPGSAQVPLPGISVDVLDETGSPVGNGNGGLLVVTEPWPAMLRGIWGDPERFIETYWEKFDFEGSPQRRMYLAGDGARLDSDGDVWVLGRVDDVMNVSGHRLSTMEIESALVSHPIVAEAAVVGASDETTGQAVVAFVILRAKQAEAQSAAEAEVILKVHVAEQIGAIARPRQIIIVTELPKTRSGKIMRRLLRDVAEGREVGDTTTLADTQVMQVITDKLK
ncbi:MAG: acetyl-coenzyme A synthetase, partial [Terrimesophilobacter sp.]